MKLVDFIDLCKIDQVLIIKDGSMSIEIEVDKAKGLFNPEVKIFKISGLSESKILVEIE